MNEEYLKKNWYSTYVKDLKKPLDEEQKKEIKRLHIQEKKSVKDISKSLQIIESKIEGYVNGLSNKPLIEEKELKV